VETVSGQSAGPGAGIENANEGRTSNATRATNSRGKPLRNLSAWASFGMENAINFRANPRRNIRRKSLLFIDLNRVFSLQFPAVLVSRVHVMDGKKVLR
jgi:hypothetical protein